MITRDAAPHLLELARLYSALAIFGPRQSGKTTLCREAFPQHAYVNLEAEDARTFARDDPRGFLSSFTDGVILDEVQNVPELLGYIQESVDREKSPGRYVLTESQHFALSSSISQSLAGRVGVLQLLPLSYRELQRFESSPDELCDVLWSGGYPRIFDEGLPAHQWLRDYFSTYVQRDVRQVANIGDLTTFSTFVRLLAGRTACEQNLSQLGADAGVSHNTARSWLSVLETSLIVTRVPPFVSNLRKQWVKSPKIYFLDSGLAAYLLGIRTPDELRNHPLRGAIFESWVASELLKTRLHSNQEIRLHHFRVNRGVEVDLIVDEGPVLKPIEVKSGATIHSDFFRGVERFRELFSEDAREVQGSVVYGGDDSRSRSSVAVVPWNAVSAIVS